MNPYDILEIAPTDNKMLIRRAYVTLTKKHHPDAGGDPEKFSDIQKAYDRLIKTNLKKQVYETTLKLPLLDFLNGCVATAEAMFGDDSLMFEFKVKPFTKPGKRVSFELSSEKSITITLLEEKNKDYKRIDENILFTRDITSAEALHGKQITVTNFDGVEYVFYIPPNTTASTLIYKTENQGFFNSETKARGKMNLVVNISAKDKI